MDIFEQEINKRFGDIALLEVNNSRLESEQSRSQEIWIALDGEESLRKPDEDLYSSTGGGQLADMFTSSTSIEVVQLSPALFMTLNFSCIVDLRLICYMRPVCSLPRSAWNASKRSPPERYNN